ncbi:hypothetical protein LINPERHAP2_LOCUS25678 [Linum perenne]
MLGIKLNPKDPSQRVILLKSA